MRRIARLLTASVAVVSSFAITQTASAESLDACGDFLFDPAGDVSCEVKVEGGCEAACTPVNLELECAIDLQVGCEGECNIEIDADCSLDCNAGCEVDCQGGEFDCGASCNVGCEADCDAECGSGDSQCSASCRANCSATCEASCNVEAPSCEAECEASCSGRCEAKANASCQIDCQAEGSVDCQAELEGGCKVACEEPSGQVFCDGQWVNTTDLDACVLAIQDAFDIEVSGYANCESDSNSASCEVGGEVSAGCSAAPGRADAHIGFMMLGLAAAGLTVARRRNKR